MLQSHAKQLQTKYMTILRREIDLRPEDIGAMRLAIGMALSEMQDEHRQQLNEMDDIIAEMIEHRDQLKAAAAADAGEILRLQTMEDRLIQYMVAHHPEEALMMLASGYPERARMMAAGGYVVVDSDVAAVVIAVLNKHNHLAAQIGRITVKDLANGNGTAKITEEARTDDAKATFHGE
jgi:hypothetical protein